MLAYSFRNDCLPAVRPERGRLIHGRLFERPGTGIQTGPNGRAEPKTMSLSIADPPRRAPPHRERLREVFRDTFDPAPELDVTQLKYRDIPAWNSVGHMQLVAALEAAFDLMLETDEIIALSSFEEAERILDRHLVSFTNGL